MPRSFANGGHNGQVPPVKLDHLSPNETPSLCENVSDALRHEHMTTGVSAATVDRRCGTHWLARLDPEGRTALMAALLSRFNHDLRTPLNTILGWTHLLQKGGLDVVREKHVA